MRERRLADVPWLALMALGGAFVLGLAALLARSRPVPVDPFAMCETVAATVASRVTSVGVLAPAILLSVVLLAAALALGHQLAATRMVLRGVLRRRVAATDEVARAASDTGLTGRVDLVHDRSAFVFCYGYLRPRVCLSTGLAELLAPDELVAVLRHEAHHLRHRDPVKILIGRAVASGLFFVPLAGALRNGFLAGKEICADRAALASAEAGALPRALVKMLRAERPSWPAGVLAVGALSPTEARIHCLVEPAEPQRTLPPPMDWIISLALVAGIFGFSYGAASAHEDPAFATSCSSATSHVLPPQAAVLGWARPALPVAKALP